MYRPAAFAVDDIATVHAAIRAWPFATLAAVKDGAVAFAYAPVVLDADEGVLGTLRFHLARGNPLADCDGAALFVSFRGPDAYVSPDWYETKGRVPTWNYIAVEARGTAQRVGGDALRALLVELSAVEEAKLAPKLPWLIEKVPAEKLAGLMNAIVGFSLRLETLTGKFKLSQNTGAADIQGVIAGLETRGDAPSIAIAEAMRRSLRKN
jgi:transcriptional regulator